MDILVTGASGLIGTKLLPALSAAGHRPIKLVRRAPSSGADEIRWSPDKGELDLPSLEGLGAVVHLAGAGIGDKRWTPAYKELLVSSRTTSTDLLASSLAGLNRPPSALLSGSAIGFYGDRGNEELTEASSNGSTFLADLVQKWEAAAGPAVDAGIRTAFLRTGIVQSADGGALGKPLLLYKLGLGGRMGSGQQYLSWISMADVVGAIVHLADSGVSGPVNLTSPRPVTNAEYTKTLGRVLRRPTLIPIPSFGPKLLLGSEMATALIFESQRVMPTVLTEDGYNFQHPTLEAGLRAVLDS